MSSPFLPALLRSHSKSGRPPPPGGKDSAVGHAAHSGGSAVCRRLPAIGTNMLMDVLEEPGYVDLQAVHACINYRVKPLERKRLIKAGAVGWFQASLRFTGIAGCWTSTRRKGDLGVSPLPGCGQFGPAQWLGTSDG